MNAFGGRGMWSSGFFLEWVTFLGGRSHEGKREDSETEPREGFGSLNDTGVTFGAKANWAEPDASKVGADAGVAPCK